jgi:hypothetical protein
VVMVGYKEQAVRVAHQQVVQQERQVVVQY